MGTNLMSSHYSEKPSNMRTLIAVSIALVAIVQCNAVEFKFRNNLPGAIWVGILGNSGKPPLGNGGFALEAFEEKSVYADTDWAGRFWARTWCNSETNHCETGDCGNNLECNGAGGATPVTLAEITLRAWEGQDFYDISLVDGFNVATRIEPIGGTGGCASVACPVDLNPNCPDELRIIGEAAGYTIACQSSCSQFKTDEYCCRGDHDQPETCNPSSWEVDSATYFKTNCPDAYSYAYDDLTSTFTCVSDLYVISFG